jgi:hypothetical protein
MDPLSLILTALTTGMQATASDVVKDAYAGLKTLIQRKFAGKPEAEMALAKHEEKPNVWKAPLTEGLQETGVDQDQDIIVAAQRLIQLAQVHMGDKKSITITIEGPVQGIITADYSTNTQTFGDISLEK